MSARKEVRITPYIFRSLLRVSKVKTNKAPVQCPMIKVGKLEFTLLIMVTKSVMSY